jgi:hypothetical protein
MRLFNIVTKPTYKRAVRVDTHDYDEMCEIVAWCNGEAIAEDDHVIAFQTVDGNRATVGDGDWIIQGVVGEFYPCNPEVFGQSFEFVDGSN